MCLCRSELSESAYEKLADETLDALADYFEDLTDEGFTGAEYDVIFSVSVSLCRILIPTGRFSHVCGRTWGRTRLQPQPEPATASVLPLLQFEGRNTQKGCFALT